MHQKPFGGRALPGPAGELTALPRPPSWMKEVGDPGKGRGGGGMEKRERRENGVGGKGREKKGERRRGGMGKGKEGKGDGKEGKGKGRVFASVKIKSWVRPVHAVLACMPS